MDEARASGGHDPPPQADRAGSVGLGFTLAAMVCACSVLASAVVCRRTKVWTRTGEYEGWGVDLSSIPLAERLTIHSMYQEGAKQGMGQAVLCALAALALLGIATAGFHDSDRRRLAVAAAPLAAVPLLLATQYDRHGIVTTAGIVGAGLAVLAAAAAVRSTGWFQHWRGGRIG